MTTYGLFVHPETEPRSTGTSARALRNNVDLLTEAEMRRGWTIRPINVTWPHTQYPPDVAGVLWATLGSFFLLAVLLILSLFPQGCH